MQVAGKRTMSAHSSADSPPAIWSKRQAELVRIDELRVQRAYSADLSLADVPQIRQ